MLTMYYAIGGGIAGILLGVLGTLVVVRMRANSILSHAHREFAQKVTDAERESAAIIRDAKTRAREIEIEIRQKMEVESRESRREVANLERRVQAKEEAIEKRAEALDKTAIQLSTQERELVLREKQLDKEREQISVLQKEQIKRLETIAGMTSEQARKELFSMLETEVKRDCALQLKRIEEELREESDKRAKWIIGEAIQRCAVEHVAETTVTVVSLPNEEMKGRIIGREGRNIRTLESATGVNVIIDDTPEAVIISGFDPVRRQIAKLVLERMIQDGRIHPARIEELVEKITEELNQTIRERGEEACLEADVHGLHPEIVKLLGKLSFRTSYGQNVLRHSIEVAHLASIMAAELGLNAQEAKRAGLIHDIGKALTHEVEGAHAVLGHDLAKRYGESETITNAIGAHHGDMPNNSVLAVLLQAADAMSASRPGARSESMQIYLKRLEQLETVCNSFSGVEKAYAIQAGREVRVIVQPNQITDAEASVLARDLARKIENEVTYPGQIKVTVVRETRAIETAK